MERVQHQEGDDMSYWCIAAFRSREAMSDHSCHQTAPMADRFVMRCLCRQYNRARRGSEHGFVACCQGCLAPTSAVWWFDGERYERLVRRQSERLWIYSDWQNAGSLKSTQTRTIDMVSICHEYQGDGKSQPTRNIAACNPSSATDS